MERGTRAGRAYVEMEINGDGMNEEIVAEVEKAGPGVEKAGEDHGEKYEDGFEQGFFARLRSRFQKGLTDELTKRADKDGKNSGGQLGEGLIEGIREKFAPLRDELMSELGDVNTRMGELRKKLDNARSPNSIDRLTASLKESRAEATRLSGQLRTLAKTELGIGNGRGVSGNGSNGRREERVGENIGKFFGAGSRNNGLNLFGKSLGGIIDLLNGARKAVTPLFKAFQQGFSEAEEGASFLQKTLGGLSKVGEEGAAQGGKVFAMLAESGPAGAAAIGIVILALTAFVSVAGAALGIVTALAATIASALAGAAIVGAGALLAVVAAAGLLVAAFKSLDDAQKKILKADFLPLKQEFVGLGQTVLKDLVPALGVMSENLQRALVYAQPVATIMGKAFGEAGKALTASFSGPGFQQFATALGTYLPGIVMNLSTALGSFLNGILGLFSAVMPYVLQFSEYLSRTADDFSRFATSGAGQNSISDFTERALVSLKSLWGFIHQFVGLVTDVLFNPQSQAAGNSIFDSLARSFANFRKDFAGAAADGSLKKFFNDSIKFGGRFMDLMSALTKVVRALYNSGVLDAIGISLEALAYYFTGVSKALGPFVDTLGFVLPTLTKFFNPISALTNGIKSLAGALGIGNQQAANGVNIFDALSRSAANAANVVKAAAVQSVLGNVLKIGQNAAANILQQRGAASLANTSKGYQNPYAGYAESLQQQGPTISRQIKDAMKALAKQINKAISDAVTADSADAARSGLTTMADNLKQQGKTLVDAARTALNSAASALGSASSAGAAAKALAKVKKAQADLRSALKAQSKLNAAASELASQRKYTNTNVNRLLSGNTSGAFDPTLADYAKARERLAVKIDAANQKLADAISVRDAYRDQIRDSIKSFADLTTAQAQTINGVEQALTAGDVTANLQDRLDKIRKFNDNLRLLLAQGLSNDAYKQLVDAGVEGGSATAQAIVDGGVGAVQQVNSLTQQISDAADSMGTAASNQLYQAGVSAAQGLVDGLKSLSKELDSAAEDLGNSIAKALRRSLGIKSPSTVLRDMMNFVGDGAALGLDDQGPKIDSAAQRFADRIAVSPEVASYATQQGQPATVSGNESGQKFRDLVVQTPTSDPKAVALEVLNEVTGRLP